MDNALGDFLRSRRARIQPEEVGLPPYNRRRVPGLRREEVAQLAGMSVDYYIRLEQGRGKHVSDAVLNAVARVLRLDPTEREHLRDLARPERVEDVPGPSARIRPGVRLLLDAMKDTPACVLGHGMDVLAWNALGDAVSGFSRHRAPNNARAVFLSPEARDFYPDWQAVAAETVAFLRLSAGRCPGDRRMRELIGELSLGSEDFRRLWADHPVKEKTWGVKRINHPVVGGLEVGYETLALPGDPDQALVVYTAEPGSATAERLALLASWSAGAGTGPGTGGHADARTSANARAANRTAGAAGGPYEPLG